MSLSKYSTTFSRLAKAALALVPVTLLSGCFLNWDGPQSTFDPAGPVARQDEVKIRTTALYQRVPVMTTLAAAQATLRALQSLKTKPLSVKSLQEYHAGAR